MDNKEMIRVDELTREDIEALNRIANLCHFNAVQHGFHPTDKPLEHWFADQVNNMHSEVSELWDAFRAGKLNDECDKNQKLAALALDQLSCAEEEYADIIIRAFDQARRLGLDIGHAIAVKHAYNITREHKHGKLN